MRRDLPRERSELSLRNCELESMVERSPNTLNAGMAININIATHSSNIMRINQTTARAPGYCPARKTLAPSMDWELRTYPGIDSRKMKRSFRDKGGENLEGHRREYRNTLCVNKHTLRIPRHERQCYQVAKETNSGCSECDLTKLQSRVYPR